jgi:hypothetical protein
VNKILPYIEQITKVIKEKNIPDNTDVLVYDNDTQKATRFIVRDKPDNYQLELSGPHRFIKTVLIVRLGNKIVVH